MVSAGGSSKGTCVPAPQPTPIQPRLTSGRGLKYVLAGVALAVAVGFTILAPALESADAAKGGGGGGGGGKKGGGGSTGASYTGSFSLVVVSDADGGGLTHGDQITFSATSNAPTYFVDLTCTSQVTGMSFTQSLGVYPGWTWGTTYDLYHWYYWPSGGGTCSAVLLGASADGSGRQSIGSPMSLTVAP